MNNTLKEKAENLQKLLNEKTGIEFNISLGATGKNYTVQGPFGTMLFWVSEENVVYLVDIMADAPTVVETVLYLLEQGVDLVYSGPYAFHPTNSEYVIGIEAYDHKETWFKKINDSNKNRIFIPE